ncbi:CBS domain-containing protein CBSX6-like [Panicum miliaceum]|uniref:CBS domain-containing protein CBSX6-like n=1 Tax=Panicum miliaceum TaxID=4540 RepID=A0A3L6PQ64_PANMI|nr:CBS domain-containing protein CBSX6-like [Panicum miliaceum]
MAHIVFLRASAADLTAGKPPLRGVPASAPLSAAAAAIPASQEADVAVWRDGASPLAPAAATVIGLLSSFDVVAFLASHVGGTAAALRTPAGDVVAHEPALVREVEPHTRLIEIVELMKQGARRVLVRKNITEACTVDKKPFAPFYKAALKITGTPRAAEAGKQIVNRSSSSPTTTFGCDRYCCLTREDIVRFLINCLGALTPTPLQSISSLGAVNRGYAHMEASSPAIEASWMVPAEPRAVAVVQTNRDGTHKVLADVSAHRLWRRDYVAAADAMASLSSLNFAAGVESHGMSAPDGDADGPGGRRSGEAEAAAPLSRLSSRRVGFEDSLVGQMMMASHGGNAALRCRSTSSLAAVMAQMLSYRTTHIWVTHGEDDVLVGVVGYMEIFNAVTRDVVAPPA